MTNIKIYQICHLTSLKKVKGISILIPKQVVGVSIYPYMRLQNNERLVSLVRWGFPWKKIISKVYELVWVNFLYMKYY